MSEPLSFYASDSTGFGEGAYVPSAAPFTDPADSFDHDNEPPLLEELGIDPESIKERLMVVLRPHLQGELQGSDDVVGPILLMIILGTLSLLRGQIHFAYIYGVSLTGILGMWGLLHMMSEGVQLTTVASVLGYCVLPQVLLAGGALLLRGSLLFMLALGTIGWSSWSASFLFCKKLALREQRVLVAYPLGLFYSCFVLLCVF